jgi:signal transduction histidine kinase
VKATGEIQTALLDIANQFGATVDLNALLEVVLDRFAGLMQAERALFLLYDRRGARQAMVTHQLAWDGDLDNLPVSSGLLEAVRDKRAVVVVPDALDDQALSHRKSVKDNALRMLVGVPVFDGARIVAILYADSQGHAAQEWPDMVPVLEALARLVASALASARLFEMLRFRSRLMAELVHELRGPLAVAIMGTTHLLNEGLEGEQREAVQDLRNVTDMQNRIVENALALWRASADDLPVEEVEVPALIEEHLRHYRAFAASRAKAFLLTVTDGVPAVPTLPDRLLVVFNNLVVNALKYGERGATIDVSVDRVRDAGPEDASAGHDALVSFFRTMEPLQAAPGSGFVRLSVSNVGPSIASELLPRLFDPFTRGDGGDASFGSSGLGLSIAADCVAQLGGRIWVDREAGRTAFRFTIPERLSGRAAPTPTEA